MTTKPHYVPDNAIARLVLEDPNVFSNAHHDDDALVLALKGQLLVHRPTRHAKTDLDRRLREVADPISIASPAAGGPDRLKAAEDDGGDTAVSPLGIELWKLNADNEDANPIDLARELLRDHGMGEHLAADGSTVAVPSVTPNHLAIVSGGRGSGCPAGPPQEARRLDGYIVPFEGAGGPRVAILDTGYIRVDPPHARLDERVTVAKGQWLNTDHDPAEWEDNPPDEITRDAHGRLIGIVGHGTFIAGQVAHVCPEAAITVVGHRDNEISVDASSYRLWASELSLAHSLWTYRDADVIQCGFAFPTLDDTPSLPFTTMMAEVRAAHPGIAVVSPAGNEDSTRRYWPAALPDVIGVGATKHDGRHRARFSNWGPWVDCCAIGEGVRSTYIWFKGRVEDEHPDHLEDFEGWARWDGTSFAAPKVSAAIARAIVEHPEWTPFEAYERLVNGDAGLEVRHVFDEMWPGGTLPELVIH